MKKILLIVLSISLMASGLFAVSIPEKEKCIIETEGSPFAFSPLNDGIAVGILGATTGLSLALPHIINMPKYDEFTYDLDDVNPLDRRFARKYSKKLDRAGDVSLAFSYCLVPAIYGTEWLCNNFETKEGLKLAVIYTETILATQTAKCLLKTAIKRKRPYMYFEGFPENELDNYDFEFSLPSGHSTDSFMNVAFLTYTFNKYYPESSFRIPVIAGAYTVAFSTAALRMASGNHFLTDTLAGAALGTTIGIAVPWLHVFANKLSTDKARINISPMSLSMTFKF